MPALHKMPALQASSAQKRADDSVARSSGHSGNFLPDPLSEIVELPRNERSKMKADAAVDIVNGGLDGGKRRQPQPVPLGAEVLTMMAESFVGTGSVE
jgi:hypothetical protein